LTVVVAQRNRIVNLEVAPCVDELSQNSCSQQDTQGMIAPEDADDECGEDSDVLHCAVGPVCESVDPFGRRDVSGLKGDKIEVFWGKDNAGTNTNAPREEAEDLCYERGDFEEIGLNHQWEVRRNGWYRRDRLLTFDGGTQSTDRCLDPCRVDGRLVGRRLHRVGLFCSHNRAFRRLTVDSWAREARRWDARDRLVR
jgi:hypothetical protein